MKFAVRHTLQLHDPAGDASEAEALLLPVAEAQAVMGETVAAFLARVAWRFDLPTVCRINGEYYLRAEWPTRALAANDNVEFVSRPLGSGSTGSTIKSIASVVALVALTAVAGPAGSAAAGALLFGGGTAVGTLATVISAAIVGAGALAISYFLSPKSGGKSKTSDELYSFGLQGNASRPLQPIPVLNGRVRFAPDYAAPTYSEYDGDAMTDYALFALTCGRLFVEQLLIGDTPIWNHDTGAVAGYEGIEVQIAEPGEQVTLYPVNVVTADELSGAELTNEWTPGYIVNAAGTTARKLLLDFVWPGGIYRTNERGATIPGSTHLTVRIRPVDLAGAPTGEWVEVFGRVYTFAKQTQIRITERIDVAPGRYEVSTRRVNPPQSASGKGSDAVTWSALRAHIDGPQSFPHVTTLAVKGVASQRLSGVSGGQLKVVGTRILPVWKNGAFVEEPTRSIAWAALDWWRNADYAAGLSLTDTHFQAFVAYDALWASLGHTFDYRFTEEMNLDEALETVLKAGRAFPAPVGDKLTITRDQPRGLSRMLFTENDIVRDSLEIDYALSDVAWADGIVGEYVDQTTWRLAEVSSAPDGVQLLKPARVQLKGIVDRKQATGVVRFMAAESQYRRITVAWAARSEGRLLKRGDLVKISAEEPETWGQSCEIVGVEGRNLTLDPPPVWEATGNHYVEIRRRDGRPWGPVKVVRGTSDAIAVVNAVDAASTEAAQGMSLADTVARSDTQERAWLAFSPGQPRTFPVLITEGDPDQDGEHIHLKGVLDAPEVYTTTEDGVVPLPQTPDLFSSALPAILGLGARISQRQLTLVLTAGWQPAKNAASYVADVSYDHGETWIRAYEGDRSEFEAIVGASDGMRVRVAGITPQDTRGAFYVVEVIAPDISVDGGLIDILNLPKLGYDNLVPEIRERLDATDRTMTNLRARAADLRKALSPDPAIRATAFDPTIASLRGDLDLLIRSAAANAQSVALLNDSLRAAGLEVLPAEGRVRIYAVERLQNEVTTQITNLGISLDAAVAKIDLYGSVQTGDLSGLIDQITTVQTTLDALAGTITDTVSQATFDALGARVGTAETKLDAQAAAIALRATTASLGDTNARVTTAEQRISATEGRIFQQVTAGQTDAADRAMLPTTLGALLSLLGQLSGQLGQDMAYAQQSITAKADEAGRSIAEQSAQLVAFRGDTVASFTEVTRAIAAGDAAEASQRSLLAAQVGTNAADIVAERVARVNGEGAFTSRLDGLSARMGNAEAANTSEATARANADGALGTRIDNTNARVGNVEGSVSTEAVARSNADTALGQRIDTAQAAANNAAAAVQSESTARANADGALASQTSDLYARSDLGTAVGRFAMIAGSGVGGSSVRLYAQASIDSYGGRRNAGWYLDLMPDGTSRFIVDATAFAITANGGITYPFTFDGNTLTITNLRVTNEAILPGAVGSSGFGRTGSGSANFQVACRANSRVSISCTFDGQPTVPLANGAAGRFRLLRNGTVIEDLPISFYVNVNAQNNVLNYTLATPLIYVDRPGAGSHTYTIQMTSGQGPISWKFDEASV